MAAKSGGRSWLQPEFNADTSISEVQGSMSRRNLLLRKREKLIVGAAAGVMRIYRYFEDERLTTRMNPTYRRLSPKVERNDLCPCGSGKKFKHCCGKIVLH